ncbi:MAG: VWA domain-containing protein [Deltaproteobacteria bacterium]|jgi:uncharacterized protein YegL|nr:VWA domain-containing protein [Deltaproteobacteria bacterium]
MFRRLPVYLLLDVSESMIGQPLASLEEGVRLMVRSLMRNPYALETLYLGVITFARKAETAVPLTELASFSPPALSARPGTALGAALRLCRDSISREVVTTTPERKGDFKPLVFVMTDGEPTDEWRDAADALRNTSPRPAVVSVGCGDEADFDVLRELSGGDAVNVKDLTAESMQTLFSWVSASLEVSSKAVGAGADPGVSLDKVPQGKGISLVKKDDPAPPKARARLFFHVNCIDTGKKYLTVYLATGNDKEYAPSEAHPLPDDFYRDGEAPAGTAAGVSLKGCSKCPFCGAGRLFFCKNCKKVYCWNGSSNFYCPGCNRNYEVVVLSVFDINRSLG